MHSQSQVKLSIILIALVLNAAVLTYLYLYQGFSATWIFLTLVLLALLAAIFSLLKRQNRQLESVIRAFANGDSTLGLSADHPMRNHFENVKKKVKSAQFSAEQHSLYLQTLLIHIDLAIIICNERGDILECNPAATKLLSTKVTQLKDLAHIGQLIDKTNNNLKTISQWQSGEQQDTLSIHIGVAEVQGKIRKVVTLQSIHEELINKEQHAYKQLTQVLTHEVANSITPLASIAHTCQTLIPQQLSFANDEDKQDLQLALNTLASRTEYLGEFIMQFRQISRLPKPNLAATSLASVLKGVIALHSMQFKQHNITVNCKINEQQMVMLDQAQIEQVLINLVKNALEALLLAAQQKSPTFIANINITLAHNTAQQLYIDISDNGLGIEKQTANMMFVPFFTTKQQGSGIGLSLSRQIMLNHGGDLLYLDKPQGACFRCLFG